MRQNNGSNFKTVVRQKLTDNSEGNSAFIVTLQEMVLSLSLKRPNSEIVH